MYLSRLILNPRSRAVWRDLADCQALHRTAMSAFPSTPQPEPARASLGVLFRLDIEPRSSRVTMLVQSSVEPNWSRLEPGYLLDTRGNPPNPACKSIDEVCNSLAAGKHLAFRLRANPTRKIDTKSGPDGQRRNGKRVEIRDEAAQIEWLHRKGEESGFRLVAVGVDPQVPNIRALTGGKLTGKRPHNPDTSGPSGIAPLTLASVTFEGELVVADAAKFRQALEHGIGPGKAYGFGLLSVARPVGGAP